MDVPHAPHIEKHFEASETVRDVVIGMSDGLTVPFALAAGLTGMAVATSKLVVVAGLAEIAAGSIAMGLGGYLAAKTDRDHYRNELAREMRETIELPEKERDEVAEVFRGYGMTDEQIRPVVDAITQDRKKWVDFMMRFELGFSEAPDAARARNSAATIAGSYIVGGLVPLSAYMVLTDLRQALMFSVAVTLVALFIFGYVKGRLTGISPVLGGLRTVFIGGLASAAAFGLARWIS
jgi:VIT1/CCC1 family predicted Fe2+/Mn2+ transporter